MAARDIIIRPIVTEKSMASQEADNKVTFEVAKGSNKTEVRQAVEEIFNVKVEETGPLQRRRPRLPQGHRQAG